MYQPKTPAQYLELVDQAIFEVEDLLRCAEDEEGGYRGICQPNARLPGAVGGTQGLARSRGRRPACLWRQAGFAVHSLGAPVAFTHTFLCLARRPEYGTQGGVLKRDDSAVSMPPGCRYAR